MNSRFWIWVLFMPLLAGAQAQLPWSQDPEGQGMGGIFLPNSGRYQPLGNPANLAILDGVSIGGFTTHNFGLSELSTTCIRTSMPARHGGIGGSLAYSGFGGLRHYAIQVGFGHRLWNRVNGGVQVDMNLIQTPERQLHTAPNIVAGLSVPLGRSLDIGVFARNPIPLIPKSPYHINPQMAVTLCYRLSPLVHIATEWFQEVTDRADVRMGISYTPIKNLDLRIGYQARTASFWAGTSYRIRRSWNFSLAAGYHPILGFTPSAGFGFQLENNP